MTRLAGLLVASLFAAGGALAEPVRQLGRTVPYNLASFYIQWPASGFETRFTGSRLSARITDTGGNWLTVEIDGQSKALPLRAGTHDYVLYQGERGDHSARVTRRTGPSAGLTRISLIRTDGRLSAPTTPSRRLLVIGDSVAAGFGLDGAPGDCPWGNSAHNADKAFPALLAREFGAELHLIASESVGVLRAFDGGTETIEKLERQALPAFPKASTPSGFAPDALILHAGANDFGPGEPGPGFRKAYDDLLAQLRATYPKTPIIVTFGSMLHGEAYRSARDAISESVGQRVRSGDPAISFTELAPGPSPGRYGCSWHPGPDAHQEMARQLSGELSKATGWGLSAE